MRGHVRKVFGSGLTIEANWTEEQTPQLDSVTLSSNRIRTADLSQVIGILNKIYADHTTQVHIKARKVKQ